MGDRWLDIGERYEIDSIMQYGGVVDEANGIYSMTRKDNGEPVRPRSGILEYSRVTSIDIIQLRNMYQNFCPNRPSTLDCDNGDYFLAGRACDAVPDCTDNSDESITYCGSYH